MSPETAQMTEQFLQRVTLKPDEIQAFTTIMRELSEIITPPKRVRKAKPKLASVPEPTPATVPEKFPTECPDA